MKELIDFLKVSFARLTDLPQPVQVRIDWFPPRDVNRDPSFSLPSSHELCVYLTRGKCREFAVVPDVTGPVGAIVKVISPADGHLGKSRKQVFEPSNQPVQFTVHRGEFGIPSMPQKASK
jgi:hypothetical protein